MMVVHLDSGESSTVGATKTMKINTNSRSLSGNNAFVP